MTYKILHRIKIEQSAWYFQVRLSGSIPASNSKGHILNIS